MITIFCSIVYKIKNKKNSHFLFYNNKNKSLSEFKKMLKLLCRKLIKFWTEFFNTNQ